MMKHLARVALARRLRRAPVSARQRNGLRIALAEKGGGGLNCLAALVGKRAGQGSPHFIAVEVSRR